MRILVLLLLSFNFSGSSPIPKINNLSNDAILPTGNHTFEIDCDVPIEKTMLYSLKLKLLGQESIETELPCDEPSIITFTIDDPGSYFMHLTLISQMVEEITITMSFEIVKSYNPIIRSTKKMMIKKNKKSSFIVPTHENPFHIVHISDLGTMDGYKGHLLQQLIHMPRGLYKQTIMDLSCSPPDKKVFKKYLDNWNLRYTSKCIQIPQPRWNSVAEWANDLRSLDKCKTLNDVEPMMLLALRPLVNVLLKSDIMVITNGSGDYDSYLICLGRLTNTRVILDLGPKGPLSIPWTIKGLTTFVTQSNFVTNHPYVVSTGVQIYQNPPIVDFMSFSYPAATRVCPARNNHSIRVGFIGRLAAQKAPGMFIRAAALVAAAAAADMPITFVIAGIGPLEFDLRQLALRLKVTIEFSGYVQNNNLKCLLYNLDIFVFSSMFEESFGMSPVEAMLMNLPVIGFGMGGSQDFLIHNKTGLVVKERTPQALAIAIIHLTIDAKKRKRLGKQASFLVRQLYNPSNLLQKYKDMYGELMYDSADKKTNK
jgi:glycosyltransferase involved in cell wall biosynthesis